LLGESTCMWVTTILIKIMFGPYILIFHQINFYTLFFCQFEHSEEFTGDQESLSLFNMDVIRVVWNCS
jgi:hypothetical protein